MGSSQGMLSDVVTENPAAHVWSRHAIMRMVQTGTHFPGQERSGMLDLGPTGLLLQGYSQPNELLRAHLSCLLKPYLVSSCCSLDNATAQSQPHKATGSLSLWPEHIKGGYFMWKLYRGYTHWIADATTFTLRSSPAL